MLNVSVFPKAKRPLDENHLLDSLHTGIHCPHFFCMNIITEDICKEAAQQALSKGKDLQRGMAKQLKEFVESGAEVYKSA